MEWGTGIDSGATANSGWLGQNDVANYYTPRNLTLMYKTATQTQAMVYTAVGVYCGQYHSMALMRDGTFYTWGSNQYYQLGDGSTANKNTANKINIVGKTFAALGAGQYHGIGLTDSGSVYGWGWAYYGRIGNGVATNSFQGAPLRMSSDLSTANFYAVDIATYQDGTAVLMSTGNAYVVGYNDAGILGTSSTYLSQIFSVNALNISRQAVISRVSSGPFSTSLALVNGGTSGYYGLGSNSVGVFGIGTTTATNTVPVAIPAPLNNTTIVAASYGGIYPTAGSAYGLYLVQGMSCFSVFATDPFVCSGRGTCTAQDTCSCRPGFIEIDCSVAICYDYNSTNLLVCSGNGFCMSNNTCVCRQGYYGPTCASSASGLRYASGYDGYGELGDWNYGADQTEYTPINPSETQGKNIKAAASGFRFAFFIYSDGSLWGAGSNTGYQLGDTTTTNRPSPVPVSGLTSEYHRSLFRLHVQTV
jgi:alpha-tubulin suppressor-like RCC1 family protein